MSSVDTTLQPAVSRDQSRTLFGQTMGLVAVTTGFFALGAYVSVAINKLVDVPLPVLILAGAVAAGAVVAAMRAVCLW